MLMDNNSCDSINSSTVVTLSMMLAGLGITAVGSYIDHLYIGHLKMQLSTKQVSHLPMASATSTKILHFGDCHQPAYLPYTCIGVELHAMQTSVHLLC